MSDFEKLSILAADGATKMSSHLGRKSAGTTLMHDSYVLSQDDADHIMHFLVEASRVFHQLKGEVGD